MLNTSGKNEYLYIILAFVVIILTSIAVVFLQSIEEDEVNISITREISTIEVGETFSGEGLEVALENLGIFEFSTYENDVVKNIDAINVIINLLGLEENSYNSNADYFNNDYPEEYESYLNSLYNLGVISSDFKYDNDLTVEKYLKYLINALSIYAYEITEADFSEYLNIEMTENVFAAMTYKVLQLSQTVIYTTDASGTEVNQEIFEETDLINLLIEKGVIDEYQANQFALVDTMSDEEQLEIFYNSMLNDSQNFIYTLENCEMLVEMFADETSPFVFVDPDHLLPADFVPDLIEENELPYTRVDQLMQEIAYVNLVDLFAVAEEDEIYLYSRSGYRSYVTQVGLWGDGTNPYKAEPGSSEHQTGLVMDVVTIADSLSELLTTTVEAEWIRQHCYEFGFIVRYPEGTEDITGYPAEWWHLRYVGNTIAYECTINGITFDEFYANVYTYLENN